MQKKKEDNMEYKARTEEEEKQLEEQNRDFLFLSKEEYEMYRKTKNLNRFRQAADKLFALAQNIIKMKSGTYFRTFKEFATEYKESNVMAFKDRKEKLDFLFRLKGLHSFYYHGIEEADDIEALENNYKEVYEKLEGYV